MDAFDRHLVSFVLTWEPFGGPLEEDVFPRFGLSVEAVYARFDRIVTDARARTSELDEVDEELVRRASALTFQG